MDLNSSILHVSIYITDNLSGRNQMGQRYLKVTKTRWLFENIVSNTSDPIAQEDLVAWW
jgi:hypothetical protein